MQGEEIVVRVQRPRTLLERLRAKREEVQARYELELARLDSGIRLAEESAKLSASARDILASESA